ncbi:MAG: lysophospholipid acyltransferase family protein [Planctomycetaceae bacterium]|nr:lysophospholipid acyltransferase family protein [Planctomycetaceae bacterium]MDC0274335.1 lysophospholipid acyltransferase family protein [Planctomycetaceae bacterium]MDG2387732.1 lysophospholipid acyltransferase family protein [Planctomycetaceae bacterium]
MKIRSPRLTRMMGWCLGKSFRLLARTIRYRVIEEYPGTNLVSSECNTPYLYALWHDQTFMPITYRVNLPHKDTYIPAKTLVSKHQDGSWLSEFMKHFDLGAVRGSSSKGGATALKKLLATAEKCHIVITPDGPRGPRHKVKPGIVYLASQTGIPIVANANAVSRFWDIAGSWTNQIIPKPFSKVILLTGTPIHVPEDISREQMEEYQAIIEADLVRLQQLADQLLNGQIKELPDNSDRAKISQRPAA